jgi:hypothetical protein
MFMRQSVKLTGLGTTSFKDCIENIPRLNQILSRQVPEGNMDLFQQSNFLEHPAGTIRWDDPHHLIVKLIQKEYLHRSSMTNISMDLTTLFYIIWHTEKRRMMLSGEEYIRLKSVALF